jgi:hypothetical protein
MGNDSLSQLERHNIAQNVRGLISTYHFDEIYEIRKLKIMLNLFEQYGREFNLSEPVPELPQRHLDIKLFKDKPCSVVLRKVVSV